MAIFSFIIKGGLMIIYYDSNLIKWQKIYGVVKFLNRYSKLLYARTSLVKLLQIGVTAVCPNCIV